MFRIVLHFDEIITRLNYANLHTILGGDVKVKVNYGNNMQHYKHSLPKVYIKQTSVIDIAKLSWIALNCYYFSSSAIEVYKKWAQTDCCLFRIL
jgi:hypothetical protein